MSLQHKKLAGLGLFFLATLVVAALVPPVAQDPAFHDFVDKRPWLGIPNFGDVVSNVGFLIVGVLGLYRVAGPDRARLFDQAADAMPYMVLFAAITCVTAGSVWFHLDPNHDTLVWDRLPMTVAFMSFFAAVIADRIDRRAGLVLLPFLILAGMASVVQWYLSELVGAGDLRPYAVVQFFPMVAIPLIVWLFRPGRYTDGRIIAWIIGLYAAAKLLEIFDAEVFELLGGTISGHSLKHLVAAGASYCLLRMVEAGSKTASASISPGRWSRRSCP